MKTSTRLLCLIGLIASIATSCSKEYTCSHNIHYYPLNIAFKGYSSSDLSKVAITIYDGSFNQQLETDTFDFSTATFKGDTAYAENGNFLNVQTGKGYTINVLTRNKTHKISNVHEGGNTYSWTQKEVCSMDSTQSENRGYLFDLDGQQIASTGLIIYLAD